MKNFGGAMMVLALVAGGEMVVAQGLRSPTAGLKGGVTKVPIKARVLQVLPEGLLFAGGASPYLLTGHPHLKKMADGQVVNCFALKTEATFKYSDTRGAVRTVRVYRYLNERIGK